MGKKSILQINTFDKIGGAARIAWELRNKYEQSGFNSYLAVGHKTVNHNYILQIPKHFPVTSWETFWYQQSNRMNQLIGKVKGAGKVKKLLNSIAWPKDAIDALRGVENFNFSGTKKLLALTPKTPDILHLHNLHGDYFDLRMLPKLSNRTPTIITLHDAWLLSGHCAHSFDCDRWKYGCGKCPDLSIYPALKKDTTRNNWIRKKNIFERSKLYISTPCKWLMDKVEQSILSKSIIGKKVIPNGVDTKTFKPGNKKLLRRKHSLPLDAFIFLFVSQGGAHTPWKDFQTLERTLPLLPHNKNILVLSLGSDSHTQNSNTIPIKHIPYQTDRHIVREYFALADVYVHPAHAETFPNVILEALACGLPVIASNIGGIPEQVLTKENKTGMLVKKNNSSELAKAMVTLLENETLRLEMSRNARRDAEKRFSLSKQTKRYITWIEDILCKPH